MVELSRGLSRRRLLTVAGTIAAGAAATACGGSSQSEAPAGSSGNPAPTSSAPANETPATASPASVFPAGVQVYGPEDGPAVLALHPWWGISPGVLAWKDALVAAGGRVVLPDLYGGKVVDTIPEAEALSNAIDDDAVFDILDACAETLNAGGRPWQALGWSLGAFYVSQMFDRGDHAPERAVLFYGAAAPSGQSRTAAVQLHVAPDDQYFTDQEIAAALAGFERAGIAVERYDYPGLHHWFAEVGSPAYDAEGTRVATQRALAFLGLPAPG